MQNILKIVALYLIGIGVMGFLLFTILVNLPHKTFVINSITVQSPIKDQLTWTSNACRYTDRPITVTRTLTNTDTGDFYTIPDHSSLSVLKVGQCATNSRTVQTPDVPPGNYTLTIHIETTYNRWNMIPTVGTSNQFVIEK